MRALSPEGVLSVNPSGILALQGSGPKEAVDVLKKASVPYIVVPETFDHAGILDRIRVVGKAIGADAKAEALAADVDKRLKAAEALTADVKERKRILFILSFKDGRILASGQRHRGRRHHRARRRRQRRRRFRGLQAARRRGGRRRAA